MTLQRVDLLAQEVVAGFGGTGPGHCARVDFLDRDDAIAVRDWLDERFGDLAILARVLQPTVDSVVDRRYITTDQAIETRNRKTERLCLFVPTDLIDAAVSSLGNSFALIDGRTLQAAALEYVLGAMSGEARRTVRAVFHQLRGTLRTSDDQKLDFATAVLDLDADNLLGTGGLELWRVGLTVDGDSDFASRLTRNRRATLELSRPIRLLASIGDRLQSVGVDVATGTRLVKFFRGRPLHDVCAWSRDLLGQEELTFDRWTFPQTDQSDIQSVTVRPFLTPEGNVEKYCWLAQPDGAGGSLLAPIGAKSKLVVRWGSDPPNPSNLGRWRVEIVPSGNEMVEGGVDLPIREVAASRRTATLSLDFELTERPDYGVVVRITALDSVSNAIEDIESGTAVVAESDEFFLETELEILPEIRSRDARLTVPTVSYGRLETAVNVRETALVETQVQWHRKEEEYFSLRLNQRHLLNVGLSATLLELERRVIAEPRQGGCWLLEVDELAPVEAGSCAALSLETADRESWVGFWRARDAFLGRLKRSHPRDVIEAADWTSELAGAAVRYAQSYRELVEALMTNDGDVTAIREALSVDTLLIKVHDADASEDMAVVLPTHPLRAAWFAGYTQLLRSWEDQILNWEPKRRKTALDLHAIRALAPTNVPAFACHMASDEVFVFFQNLRFFHGISLPAGAPDPHRRYADAATLLGAEAGPTMLGDLQPGQLSERLTRFRDLHPYVNDLEVTLINPGQGDFFAEAIRHMQQMRVNTGEEPDQVDHAPTGNTRINAFVEDPRKTPLRALDSVREMQPEALGATGADFFLPRMTTSLQPLAKLSEDPPPAAHVTVVADFTQPKVVGADKASETGLASSHALYGLITRFVPEIAPNGDGFRWRHRIVKGAGRPEPHPAGGRYGDVLEDLHEAILNATGRLLTGTDGAHPVLEVAISADRRGLLDRLQAKSSWLITLDRFFPLDYYDSPSEPNLRDVAETYVLDYSPEATEGLAHRLIVTTDWRDEIGVLLRRAMGELGFATVDRSVRQLLHHLKTVSGRLAMQVLESDNTAAATVGLGAVAAWLEARGRLRQAVLMPVDLHPRVYSKDGYGALAAGERRCDLVLIALRRNIVDATFIEVKWRRGRAPLDELAGDMLLQMERAAESMRDRFFNSERLDGSLQRAHLANVLRFYFERARRYRLFESTAEASFLEQLARLEKTGLQFRPSFEGYVVSLDQEPRQPFQMGDARITVLTAVDFERDTEISTAVDLATPSETAGKSDAGNMNISRDDGSAESADDEETGNSATVQPAISGGPSDRLDSEEAAADGPPRQNEQGEPRLANDMRIPLGDGADGEVAWTPSTKGSPHLFIIGIPGQGKSWAVGRILRGLTAQRVPPLVLDFHGQFNDLESSATEGASWNVLDASAGLPFSPFEVSSDGLTGDWKVNTFAIAEIFAYVAGLGDMQRDVVYTAIRDAYVAHGFAESGALGLEYPTLAEVLDRIEEQERVRRVSNVTARCRPLLEMELFRPTAGELDLLSSIRGGLVIDLHSLYVETLQLAAGAFVLRKIYKDMFRWGPAEKIRLVIVLDEAHRLARDTTLPKIMKEGRKFGIAVVVASQGMSDFHQDVLGNAGTKVIFRTNYPESRKIAGYIRARQGQDLASRIEQLTVGSAYVQTPEMPYGATVKMHPLE